VEAIDDKTYECIVKQSVGPISVRLKFTVVLTEVDPPKYIKAVSRGEAIGKMGTFTSDVVVNSTEISKDEVEVSYQTNVNIVGRLATFGERIMRAKAKSVGEKFTKNLQEKLKTRTAI
jgi:carbon monoxide dehydrogenase subunit G